MSKVEIKDEVISTGVVAEAEIKEESAEDTKVEVTPIEEAMTETDNAEVSPPDEVEVSPEEAMKKLDEEIKQNMSEEEKQSVDKVIEVVKNVTSLEAKISERMHNPKPDTNIMNSLISDFNAILTEANNSITEMVDVGRKLQLDAEELQKECNILIEMKDESNVEKIKELEAEIEKKVVASKGYYENAAKIRQITEKFRKTIATADVIEEFFKTAVVQIEGAVNSFVSDPKKISNSLDRHIGLFFKQGNIMAAKKLNALFDNMCDTIYNKDNTILRHGMSKENFRLALNEAIKNEAVTVKEYLLVQQFNYNKSIRVAKESTEEDAKVLASAEEVPLESLLVSALSTLYKIVIVLGVEAVPPEYKNGTYNKVISILLNPNHRDTFITFTESVITAIQQWIQAGVLSTTAILRTLTFEEAEEEVAKIAQKEKEIKIKVYKQLAEGVLAGQISKSVLTPEQLDGIAELGYDLSTVADTTHMPEITDEMLEKMDAEIKAMEEKHGPIPTNEDGSIDIEGTNIKVQPAVESKEEVAIHEIESEE